MLIGQHVVAAPYLKKSRLEVISTGYMLIDGGMPTSVAYMSNTSPIPRDKADIALCTAMAGELLGMKAIFLDAGSGARFPVPTEMISMIKENIDLPILVGGGIRNPEMAFEMASAGADVIVVGSAVERDPAIIADFAAAVHSKNIKV